MHWRLFGFGAECSPPIKTNEEIVRNVAAKKKNIYIYIYINIKEVKCRSTLLGLFTPHSSARSQKVTTVRREELKTVLFISWLLVFFF